jgi:PadR family transcriptional regulator PadR
MSAVLTSVLHTTPIRNGSREAVNIEFGSLYPALKRLELKGWIVAKWEMSEHNRRAKVYRLTPTGRKQLRQETSEWADFVAGVARLLKPTPGERNDDLLEAARAPGALATPGRGARHAGGIGVARRDG